MKSIKSKYLFIPIVTLIVILFSSGCEKIPFDKRNKYIGEWDFSVHIKEWLGGVRVTRDEKYVYPGTIKYAEADDEIIIKYGDELSLTLRVNAEGDLTNFPGMFSNGKLVNKKKLEININNGGLGGGYTLKLRGNKINS